MFEKLLGVCSGLPFAKSKALRRFGDVFGTVRSRAEGLQEKLFAAVSELARRYRVLRLLLAEQGVGVNI